MGDLYKAYDWDKLDFLFGLVRGGARLIALHKNRFCRRGDAIGLDAGPFVAAVEYAAGVEAVVVGKPSAEFFKLALGDLGVAPDEAVMVGDDIEADIGGAQAAGLAAVQVETGKYTPADREHPHVTPDLRIASIADLPAALEGLG
jgi:HAD superfamily hydrolase (TIGR01458 family)